MCVCLIKTQTLSLSLMADWAGVSPVSSITQRPTEHALQSADLLPCLSPWWLLLSQATYFTKTAFCSSLYWKHQAKPITGINRPVISRKVSLFVCEGVGGVVCCFDLSNPSYKLMQKKKDSVKINCGPWCLFAHTVWIVLAIDLLKECLKILAKTLKNTLWKT